MIVVKRATTVVCTYVATHWEVEFQVKPGDEHEYTYVCIWWIDS